MVTSPMKLSLYTPTHNPQYLKRLGESIRPQLEGLDVEWVIVPNGPARHFGIGPFEGLPIKISVAPEKSVRRGSPESLCSLAMYG